MYYFKSPLNFFALFMVKLFKSNECPVFHYFALISNDHSLQMIALFNKMFLTQRQEMNIEMD